MSISPRKAMRLSGNSIGFEVGNSHRKFPDGLTGFGGRVGQNMATPSRGHGTPTRTIASDKPSTGHNSTPGALNRHRGTPTVKSYNSYRPRRSTRLPVIGARPNAATHKRIIILTEARRLGTPIGSVETLIVVRTSHPLFLNLSQNRRGLSPSLGRLC